MTRIVSDAVETRTVIRNGRMYEFGRHVEPAFTSQHSGRYLPELHTVWAREFSGREWRTLHYIITEH